MTEIEKRIHPLPLVFKNQEAGMKQELSCRRSTFNSWAIKKMEKDFLSNACFVTSQRQSTLTKERYREYNSALPSSAACERLFSTAGLIFVPKRTNLSDANFDRLVFLKQNGKCSRNWKTSPSKTN